MTSTTTARYYAPGPVAYLAFYLEGAWMVYKMYSSKIKCIDIEQ